MMTDEEKHFTLQDEVSEEQRSSSSLEQGFSNLVIADEIGKNLSTQDLIRSSLISRAWHSASREYLKARSKKTESDYRLCVQINDKNPCRALASFNVFLEENPDGITFNGIRHNEDYNHIFETSGQVKCPNCLMNDWEKENNDAAFTEEQIREKILEAYGKVLEEVEFKYIWVQNRTSFACPFVRFIKYVIQFRAEEIVELEFDGEDFSYDPDCIAHFMSTANDSAPAPCPCELQLGRFLWYRNHGIILPKLEILGVRASIYNYSLDVLAPALKEIKHYSRGREEHLPPSFPCHAETSIVEIQPDEDIPCVLAWIQSFQPNIKTLGIWESGNAFEEMDEDQKNKYRLDLFQLGKRTSTTLTKLTCSASDFRFIVDKFALDLDENGEENSTNNFPVLEILTLCGNLDLELLNWLDSIDCLRRFPKLNLVDLRCDIPKSNDLNGLGCTIVQDNRITDLDHDRTNESLLSTSAFKGVHSLRLENYGCSVQGFPSVLRTHFSGVKHLEFKNRSDDTHRDEFLMEIMTVAMNLPCLQEVTIHALPNELKYLYLDNLFPGKPSETQNATPGLNSDYSIHPKNYFKELKQVNICYDYSICGYTKGNKNHCNENPSQHYDVPDDLIENCFVSSHLAENICKHRPNFKFTLTIKACGPECKYFLGPANQYIEHLEPYALFSSKQKQQNSVWEIEFIDKSGCTNTKSQSN